MNSKLTKFASNKNISIVILVLLLLIPTFIIPNNPMHNSYDELAINILYRAIFVLIAGIILFAMLIIRRKELIFDKIDITFLIFYLLCWISTIFSISPLTSILGSGARYDGMLALSCYLLIYYCAKNFFVYQKWFTTILFIVITIPCSLVVLEYFNIPAIHYLFGLPFNPASPSSLLINANIFGSFITLYLPIIVCAYLFTKKKSYFVFSLIAFASMVCCLTRSAWLAFAVSSLIVFIYLIYKKDKEFWRRAILIFVSFVTVFVLIFTLKGSALHHKVNTAVKETKTIATNATVTDDMGSGRILIWKMAAKGIIDHPLLGYGPDCFGRGIIAEQYDTIYKYYLKHKGVTTKAHNEYLHTAVTTGIPSLIAYLLGISAILEKSFKEIFKKKITLILSLSIIGYLVQAFFSISVIMVAPTFWFILGLICNESYKNKIEEKL